MHVLMGLLVRRHDCFVSQSQYWSYNNLVSVGSQSLRVETYFCVWHLVIASGGVISNGTALPPFPRLPQLSATLLTVPCSLLTPPQIIY